jgi:hypothetical protein
MTRVYHSWQGFKDMQEEVRNFEHSKTGRIITQSEPDDMKKAVRNLRLSNRFELLSSSLQGFLLAGYTA